MRAVVLAVLLVGCKIDLDHASTTSTVDGVNNQREQCAINTISPLCTGADALTDCSTASSGCFTYIKTKIFDANCKSSSCHSAGGTGKLDLSSDPEIGDVSQAKAFMNLVGPTSMVDMNYKLVVPGHPEQSYMSLMTQKVAPADMIPAAAEPPKTVGYMPQANGVLCCQKLDLIDRWISGGALNN